MCSIKGCNIKFMDKDQEQLHEARDWHCPQCGNSLNVDLMSVPEDMMCMDCAAEMIAGIMESTEPDWDGVA